MRQEREFSELIAIYLPVAAVVFVLVLLALAVALVRDRAGRHGAGPVRGRPRHGPPAAAPRLELTYAVFLAVVAGLLLWRSFEAIDRSDRPEEARAAATAGPPLAVRVTAVRWNWRFDYGGGAAVSGRDLDHPSTLVVPAGRRVRFSLTSADVVHAFWLPAAKAKYDAVPGRTNEFSVTFDRGVDYGRARCSEFCGTFHDRMVFGVRVLPPAAFDRWLAVQRRRSGPAA